jgi:hypothetical protein
MAHIGDKTEYLKKIANSIEMSFEIPDAEKEIANDAKIRFEAVLKRTRDSTEHLDIIYEPFKRHEAVSTKSLVSKRGLLNRYKQKVKNNFNDLKTVALLAIRKLDNFATGDTAIQEIINSFVDSVEDVEKLVTKFLDVMGDYESDKFREDVMSTIDAVRTQTGKLEVLVKDRIIEHIDTNILSNNWMSSKRDELKLEIEDKAPFITELFEERQKALDPGSFPSSSKQTQSLNLSDAQRAYYPDHMRTMNIGEFGE